MKTVYDYGAVGDGVADDTAALQAAALAGAVVAPAARPNGGAATYRITSPVEVGSALVELDGTLDATGVPAATALSQRAALTSTGTTTALGSVTGSTPQWSRTIALANSGLAPGDLILIQSEERPVAGMTRTDRRKGELLVVSAATASQVSLVTGTYFAYNSTATVVRINPVRPRIRGLGTIRCGGVGSGHNGIMIYGAIDARVSGITVTGGEDTGITLTLAYGGVLRDIALVDSTGSATIGTTGYGVSVLRSVGVTIDTAQFRNCRHGVAGGGVTPSLFCRVHNSYSDAALLDVHEPGFEWRFDGNDVRGVNDGFLNRGQNTVLDGNRVFDSTGWAFRTKTWDSVTKQDGTVMRDNLVSRSRYGIGFDGRATDSEPVSAKLHASSTGDVLRDVYGSSEAILVAHAVQPTIQATVEGSTPAAVRLLDTQLATVDVTAPELGVDVAMERSTVTRNAST